MKLNSTGPYSTEQCCSQMATSTGGQKVAQLVAALYAAKLHHSGFYRLHTCENANGFKL
jgi:hypothetical protein